MGSTNSDHNDKLLQAVDILLAKPRDVHKFASDVKRKIQAKNPEADAESIRKLSADKVVQHYANLTAISGGATALSGVVPGLGSVLVMLGGAATDVALCIKFQVEMTMALAVLFERDISTQEEQRACKLIGGLGLLAEQAKEGGRVIGTRMFVGLVRRYLKGATLSLIKELFARIGLRFTRTALVKGIPFGVGVVIGAGANKALTTLVGKRVFAYLDAERESALLRSDNATSPPSVDGAADIDVDFKPIDETPD